MKVPDPLEIPDFGRLPGPCITPKAARRELATCAELEEASPGCLEQLFGLDEGATRLST